MFLFPMAGLSSRFVKAGYTTPKYMLTAGGKSIFWHVLMGFNYYFKNEDFLFICRESCETVDFIKNECRKIGIASFQIVSLVTPTRGQAETCYIGLEKSGIDLERQITIYNIDTVRKSFIYPEKSTISGIDGFIEVFRGDGENWSFAKTISEIDMTVVETSEKKRISPFCSTGLYYFSKALDFVASYLKASAFPVEEWDANELYIAPLYNFLIRAGKKIIAIEIDPANLMPCGIPDEYEVFSANFTK